MREHLANPGRVGDHSRKWIELPGNIRELMFDSAGGRSGNVLASSVLLEVLKNIVQLAKRSLPFYLSSESGGAFSCIPFERRNGGMLVLNFAGDYPEGTIRNVPGDCSSKLPCC